jgi:hypothetical protein
VSGVAGVRASAASSTSEAPQIRSSALKWRTGHRLYKATKNWRVKKWPQHVVTSTEKEMKSYTIIKTCTYYVEEPFDSFKSFKCVYLNRHKYSEDFIIYNTICAHVILL